MTNDEAIAVFSSYSLAEKEEFVAQLIHELTIVGRGTYVAGQDGLTEPQRLRLINEVQHRLSAYLWALLRQDERRYPDDVLLRLELEQPDDPELEQQLRAAFARVAASRRQPVA
ncbi:MAG TPA: hypothetical protein VF546_01060 [Pyrinomonadaceae bacterium]|jgi:hypothetical protein